MALIMYFTRAPRYENVNAKEIALMDSFFSWQHEKNIGSMYGSDTFEKWCGRSENELPEKHIVDYYKPFWTEKTAYIERTGEVKTLSVFDQLARIVKANQIFNWFVKNVMNGTADQEYHEVSKDMLEKLLDDCNKVMKSATGSENKYVANIDIAHEVLPITNGDKQFLDSEEYGNMYVRQINQTIEYVKNILKTTDFETHAVYFNVVW